MDPAKNEDINPLLQKRDGIIHKNIMDFIANDENI